MVQLTVLFVLSERDEGNEEATQDEEDVDSEVAPVKWDHEEEFVQVGELTREEILACEHIGMQSKHPKRGYCSESIKRSQSRRLSLEYGLAVEIASLAAVHLEMVIGAALSSRVILVVLVDATTASTDVGLLDELRRLLLN